MGHCRDVVRFDGVGEDVGLPVGCRGWVDAAHLFFDHLGDLGRGGQHHLAVGIGNQFELAGGDFFKTECFDRVMKEVGSFVAAIGMDIGNEFPLTILEGVEFALRLAMDDQCACGKRAGVFECEYFFGFLDAFNRHGIHTWHRQHGDVLTGGDVIGSNFL